MPLSSGKMDMLRQLSLRPLTAIDLPTKAQINMVLGLVSAGYARDFSAHKGHRIEIRLRIWGITAAGRAVLEQTELITNTTNQPALPFLKKQLLLQKPPKQLVQTHTLKFKPKEASSKLIRDTPTSSRTKKPSKQSNEEKS